MNNDPALTRRVALGLLAGAAARPSRAQSAPAQSSPVQPAPVQPGGRPVKIGMVLPLSGPWASIGESIKSGVDLAIEDINRDGGIRSLGGARVELAIADAEDSAEKARSAAQRLLSREPDLIGGVGDVISPQTMVITELAERAELPWITMTVANQLTDRGFRYLFESVPVASVQAELALPTVLALAQAATGRPPASVAIVADSNPAIQGMAKVWREGEFAKHGVKLVLERTFTPPLSDPTALIEELRRNRPDFLFLLPTSLPDLKLLLDKLNEFGLGGGRLPTVAIGAAAGNPDLLRVSGAALVEGLYGVFPNWPGQADAALEGRFRQKTGRPWMTSEVLNGYGEVMILRDAVEAAGVADRRRVADEIRRMNTSDGAARFFTGHLQFDEKGRRTDAPMVLVQWQGGVPRPVYPASLATAAPIWHTR